MAKRLTPLKVVRLKCLDCSCDSPTEVRYCTSVNCPLWMFRFGKNPRTIKKKRPELMDKEYILNNYGK